MRQMPSNFFKCATARQSYYNHEKDYKRRDKSRYLVTRQRKLIVWQMTCNLTFLVGHGLTISKYCKMTIINYLQSPDFNKEILETQYTNSDLVLLCITIIHLHCLDPTSSYCKLTFVLHSVSWASYPIHFSSFLCWHGTQPNSGEPERKRNTGDQQHIQHIISHFC